MNQEWGPNNWQTSNMLIMLRVKCAALGFWPILYWNVAAAPANIVFFIGQNKHIHDPCKEYDVIDHSQFLNGKLAMNIENYPTNSHDISPEIDHLTSSGLVAPWVHQKIHQ